MYFKPLPGLEKCSKTAAPYKLNSNYFVGDRKI